MVLGISVDSVADNARFARELEAGFPLLSDAERQVTREYGLLHPLLRKARRATFVLNTQGVIQQIETGGAAIDPAGAIQMCSLLKKKASE